MGVDFTVKDVIHNITVKFFNAFLPNAKKPFILKAVHQVELDIHGIASKAAVYNVSTSPKVIEDGMNAGIELIHYLVADGYKIKTPLFNLRMKIPGEYDGSEESLPPGVFPVARMRISGGFRKYLRDCVKLVFDGKDTDEGIIAKAVDEATGHVDEVMTRGNILTIHGKGLKIEGDEVNKDVIGVFFKPAAGMPIKASVIAVNTPKTLKVLVPNELAEGVEYQLSIGTQSSAKCNGFLTKKIRGIRSRFNIVVA